MSKILSIPVFLLILFWADAHSQTCGNPGARVQWLNAGHMFRDTLWGWVKSDLEFLELKKHDTVADVGSRDGYYPGIYSVFSDSVIFYLNDISESGFIYFDTIQYLCEDGRRKPLTNQFNVVIGSDSSTNLPKQFFNKVILKDVLHHFKYADVMLEDIKSIMKPDASLYLYEPFRPEPRGNSTLCRGAMTKAELLSLMEKHGFAQTVNRNGDERISEFKGGNGNYYWMEFRITKH